MTMPIDLVLVRHGESEGNIAIHAAEKGDDSLYTEAFRSMHNGLWRLSSKGRSQAEIAGAWIRESMAYLLPFDRCYSSEFARAVETAALLGLPEASWKIDFYLRERDQGALSSVPESERLHRFADAMRRRDIDSFFWAPPEGESLAQLCLRIDRVLDTLHRECYDKRVILVCHGEVMWAFRVRLERMLQHRFKELDSSEHPFDRIHNCQILHYTRRDPSTSKIEPYLGWMRSICPTDTALSRNEWEPISRKSYTNEEMLEILSHQAQNDAS